MKRMAHAASKQAEVADNMADAVTYLMRVAKDEGFGEVSGDLLLVRNKLLSISEQLCHVQAVAVSATEE